MNTAVCLFVVAYLFWIALSRSKATPSVSPNAFSQAGVAVNFAQRTLSINGRTYPVDAVRSLRWSQEWNRSFAYITVADLRSPVHKVRFNGTWNKDAAQAFVARLEQAIAQAGGPSFR